MLGEDSNHPHAGRHLGHHWPALAATPVLTVEPTGSPIYLPLVRYAGPSSATPAPDRPLGWYNLQVEA